MKSAFLRIALLSTLSLPLAAQVPARVVAPIDETNLVTLKGNVHPLAQARFDRGAAPLATPTGHVLLLLQRSAAQQRALTQFLADVQNPSSPNYHKWLTPSQYGAQFGLSDTDMTTVKSWLQAHGFKVEKVAQARNVIQFSGNFGQIQSAFHTTIHTLEVNGAKHFANMSDPQIPAALAGVVAGVGPLNDFHPKPALAMGPPARFNTTTHTIEPTLTLFDTQGNPYLYVDPADAATIYDSPNKNLNVNDTSATIYDGTGVTIGIAGDSNPAVADMQNYRIAFLNETTPNVATVIVDGNDPGPTGDGDEIEALLDTEVAGGLAPGAKIDFYTSANTDMTAGLFNAIFRALDDNAVSILNISFIGCETSQGTQGNQIVLETYEQAAAQGISVTVASGDSGSAACDDDNTETAAQNGLAVNGLASTPYNIAVGGTDYDVLGTSFTTYVQDSQGGNQYSGTSPYWETALGYIPEEPWNDSTYPNGTIATNTPLTQQGQTNIVGGGGGESTVYSKPAFQQSVTPADGARDLPDVSFLAANGLYGAVWVVCGDNYVDGQSTSDTSVDCQTSGGQFTQNSTFIGVGGTSAAAPAFAGMLALVSQSQGGARLGQVDPVLYQLAASATTYKSAFHDITTGNNSVVCASGSPNCGSNGFLTGYNAVAGYDRASGLGSVDVSNLIKSWSSVKLGATSTTLQLNGSTSAYSGVHGADVTFKVGVNPTSATGVVGIIDTANETAGGTASGPQNNGQIPIGLSGGTGTTQYNGLPGGSYTVSARYGGDTSNAASTSGAINVTISPEDSATSLQVNAYSAVTGNQFSSLGSIPYGSEIVADASITGAAEPNTTQGIATGTVSFLSGSNLLGTAAVTSENQASWPPLSNQAFKALDAASYSMTAKYSGDASYNASTSSPVTLTVAQAATTTGATAVTPSISSSGSTTVNITITTPVNYGNLPGGSVNLTVGGTALTSIATSQMAVAVQGTNFVLTGGVTVSGSQLASGSNSVKVAYSGDTNYTGSSANVSITVTTGSAASFTVTSSGNITVNAGATTGNTATITVTPSGGFTGGVNMTCKVTTSITSPNDPPTCTVSSPITITGTTAATSTLTVTTTASSTSSASKPLEKFFLGGGATLAMLFFFGIPAKRRAWRGLMGLVFILFIGGAVGCGSSGGGGTHTIPGTTAGTYTVAVTATDKATGQISVATNVTLTVN
ncbi:MAG TPA: protease pro-enzyme activation domain-containing protein [Acidobacteriaceae bacterium]